MEGSAAFQPSGLPISRLLPAFTLSPICRHPFVGCGGLRAVFIASRISLLIISEDCRDTFLALFLAPLAFPICRRHQIRRECNRQLIQLFAAEDPGQAIKIAEHFAISTIETLIETGAVGQAISLAISLDIGIENCFRACIEPILRPAMRRLHGQSENHPGAERGRRSSDPTCASIGPKSMRLLHINLPWRAVRSRRRLLRYPCCRPRETGRPAPGPGYPTRTVDPNRA